MTTWVGPWVPFSKLSRLKAIETCEILIEQRDKQIRRAEAAEALLAEVEAERDQARAALADAWDEGYDAPRVKRFYGPSGSMSVVELPIPRRNPWRGPA